MTGAYSIYVVDSMNMNLTLTGRCKCAKRFEAAPGMLHASAPPPAGGGATVSMRPDASGAITPKDAAEDTLKMSHDAGAEFADHIAAVNNCTAGSRSPLIAALQYPNILCAFNAGMPDCGKAPSARCASSIYDLAHDRLYE